MWQGGKAGNGYGTFCVGKQKNVYAHRFAYFAFKGNPKNYIVCHTCDVPSCVNPDHLFLGTQKDNMLDCKNKGRQSNPPILSGEKNPKNKLTKRQVIDIRNSTETISLLSKQYNVTYQNIRAIKLKLTWKDI